MQFKYTILRHCEQLWTILWEMDGDKILKNALAYDFIFRNNDKEKCLFLEKSCYRLHLSKCSYTRVLRIRIKRYYKEKHITP